MIKKLSKDEKLQLLNQETGRLHWQELQRFFARGVVITVSLQLDLLDVALKFSQDDNKTIENWLNDKLVAHASDDDAKNWEMAQASFWAIVVAPWVIVQKINED